MEVEEGVKYLSPNIVYREVLLHGRRLTPTTTAPTPPTLTVPDHVNDIESIYDGFEEEEPNVVLEELYGPRSTVQQQSPTPNLSRPLPVGVIPAVLPSRGEAEVDQHKRNDSLKDDILIMQAALDMETAAAAHEAWVASLPVPAQNPPTPAEQERAAMLQRRGIFMANLMEGNLEGDIIEAASNADIFANI